MFCRGFLSELRHRRNGFRKDKGGEKLAESEVIGLPLSQYAEKEHSSNIAPTAPTRSIHSTSAARNFHIATLSLSMFRGLFN